MRSLYVCHGHGPSFLRPGYRHCFLAIDDGHYWIMFDPRDGVPVVEVIGPLAFNLAEFYRDQGYAVVETSRRGTSDDRPLMLATCVGAIKRVLGVRSMLIQTPWRLFKYLERDNAESSTCGIV